MSAIGLTGPRDGRKRRAIRSGSPWDLLALLRARYLLAIQYFPDLERLRGTVELAYLAAGGAARGHRGAAFRGVHLSRAGLSWDAAVAPARLVHRGQRGGIRHLSSTVSLLPVFVMGVLAALGFELTGSIVTPLCIHMTYNGMILLTSLFRKGGPCRPLARLRPRPPRGRRHCGPRTPCRRVPREIPSTSSQSSCSTAPALRSPTPHPSHQPEAHVRQLEAALLRAGQRAAGSDQLYKDRYPREGGSEARELRVISSPMNWPAPRDAAAARADAVKLAFDARKATQADLDNADAALATARQSAQSARAEWSKAQLNAATLDIERKRKLFAEGVATTRELQLAEGAPRPANRHRAQIIPFFLTAD